MKKYHITAFIILTLLSFSIHAKNAPAGNIETYYASIQDNPAAMEMFMRAMPKGGDLHSHLEGAVYAENLLNVSMNDSLCLNKKTLSIEAGSRCEKRNAVTATEVPLTMIPETPGLYDATINAWSLREFNTGSQAARDHFFGTFYKFWPLIATHRADALAEVATRAADQHLQYIEQFIVMPDSGLQALSEQIPWNQSYASYRDQLMKKGLPQIIDAMQQQLNKDEKRKNELLGCDKHENPACQVKFHYVFLALRDQKPAYVYAQLVAGFELVKRDPRFVAVNLVQAEDAYRPLHDYQDQMNMIGYLKTIYPDVHVTLHAGELNPVLVAPEALRSHIQDAIRIAKAERIGHGLAIHYEQNANALLAEMAEKKIAVEINLTSNDKILGVKGGAHPLTLYLAHHVPVTISTDDEGILRTDISREYARAATEHHLPYKTIKEINRNSLTYSFLPGKSLWQDPSRSLVVEACRQDQLGAKSPSPLCLEFLAHSEKAQIQWGLEAELQTFEPKFTE